MAEKQDIAAASGVATETEVLSAEQSAKDLQALRETCRYISVTMGTLNAKITTMHPDARDCVQELNVQLGSLLEGVNSVPDKSGGGDALKTEAVIEEHERDKFGDQGEYKFDGSVRKKTRSALKKKARQSHPKGTQHTDSDSEASRFSEQSEELESGSVSESDHKSHKPNPGKVKVEKEDLDKPMTMEHLVRVMSRFQMDRRKVPKPELFDGDSGQSFTEFLKLFEEYCARTYQGSSSLWMGELGRFLSGEMLEAYTTLKVAGDSYVTMKDKLIKWRRDTRERTERHTRTRFLKAKIRPREGLRIYAGRLENAFRLAYPRHKVETSGTLRRKYLETVSRSVQKELTMTRSLGLAVYKTEMTWSTLLSLVSRMDAVESGVTATSDEEIESFVGLSSSRFRREVHCSDAVTQCDSGRIIQGRSSVRQPASVWSSSSLSGVNGLRESQADQRRRGQSLDRTFNGNGQGRDRRASGSGASETRTCLYCKRIGHIRANCWKLSGACLLCGSMNHRLAQCPNRRVIGDDHSGNQGVIRNVSANFVPIRNPRVTFADNGHREAQTHSVSQLGVGQQPLNGEALAWQGHCQSP